MNRCGTKGWVNKMITEKVSADVLGITQNFYETPRMILLSKALLCIDCDTIFTKNENKIGSAKVYCPNCGGSSNHYIAKFLNRKG